ncbi:hypothetical protein RAS1_17380 [Phycisphaerae bacterium RAS1]|nr:hypothetical protein RAS1_17380 [Phycisphaerae bacterium RAS1]
MILQRVAIAGALVARRDRRASEKRPTARRNRIGPRDRGRRMPLAVFARAEAAPGFMYELDKGVIVVVDVPGMPHSRIIRYLRAELEFYARSHPGRINHVAGSLDAVVRMPALQSERHPDITVYLTPPPRQNEQPWDEWVVDIAIEVVSKESRRRDYEIKPAEYLAAGVREYWIIDPLTRSATIHRRIGDQWSIRRLGPRGSLQSRLLPGFHVKLPALLSAGEA